MIVRPQPNILRLLFTLKGSIVKQIAGRTLAITLLATMIVLIEHQHPAWFSELKATPFTLLGISLSVFMNFRNNACYERWWEGRKAWGRLIIDVRSFIRESIIIEDANIRERLLRSICGFSHSLNARLRDESETQAIKPWLNQDAPITQHNVTDGALQYAGQLCSDLAKNQYISEWRYLTLEQRLHGLSDVQGVCERIKATPLPFPYTLLLHRTIYIFCILLPFAMAQSLGWMTPLFTAIVAYTFLGLDAVSDELENPFGHEPNDLPTDAMVRIIERDILGALGETNLPPLLTPEDYILT